MTALALDRKTDQLGTAPEVYPPLLTYPVAAATIIYAGALVALNASGFAVPASASAALKCVGRAETKVDNSAGAAGALAVDVHPGVFFFDQGSGADAIVRANLGSYCYASDDHTVNLTDAGGVRPLAGVILGLSADYGLTSGQIAVGVGMATPYGENPLLAGGPEFKARGVATSVAAFTASAGVLTANAVGALGTQDGLTYTAGQQIVLPVITNVTAANSGPYVVTNPGAAGAALVLTRPDWYPHGGTFVSNQPIDVGEEGSLFGPSEWAPFAANGTIGTSDPKFRPRSVTQQVTLVAGVAVITNVPIYSVTQSNVHITRKTANTCTLTYQYVPLSYVAGDLGTATVTITAVIDAGTINNVDISTLLVTIEN